MKPYRILMLCALILSIASCKKDKDGGSTGPTVDARIIGTWTNLGSSNEPGIGQIQHVRTFLFNSNSTYHFNEKSRSTISGLYSRDFDEDGSIVLSEPEAGKSEFFASKLDDKSINLDKKIVQTTASGESIIGYIQFLDNNQSFWYYWDDGTNQFGRRYSK